MALNVFISHSFKDAKLLEHLKSSLESQDVQCYVAEADPRYGESLPEKIENAIDSSEIVVVVLTKEANASPSVNQEIGYAKKGKKKIIALVEDGAKVGVMLQGLEVIMFTIASIAEALEKLTNYFEGLRKKSDDKALWLLLPVLLVILGIVLLASRTTKK